MHNQKSESCYFRTKPEINTGKDGKIIFTVARMDLYPLPCGYFIHKMHLKEMLIKNSPQRASVCWKYFAFWRTKKVSPLHQDVSSLSQPRDLKLLVQQHLAVYNCLAWLHQKNNFHLG